MAKLHAVRVAAMFAADADLQFGARLAPSLDAPAHQHTDTLGVQRLEWVCREHCRFLLIHIVREETAGVIAGEPHSGLPQVVGPERERVPPLRNLPALHDDA